jgi:beta-phosphoglucomutase-like phosphatase (HAD superfamily)
MTNTSSFGVLWDMDGTIVDTVELHFQTWFAVLSERKISITRESLRAAFGQNAVGIVSAHLERYPEPALLREIIDCKEALFQEMVREQPVPLIPGVIEWLETLQARGVKQAITLSAPVDKITAIVEKLDLGKYFAALVPGADLPPNRRRMSFWKPPCGSTSHRRTAS